jgi:nucleotide-binding universal stress UspA family protein
MNAISTVLVPVDLSASSRQSFESACRVAELFAAARVHLLHVVQHGHLALDLVRSSKELLAQLTSPSPSLEITRETRMGIPAREIVFAADKLAADLCVIRIPQRNGLGQLVLGSVAHTVVRAVRCPVLVVGDDRPFRPPDRVLAAVDLSPVSACVLEHANTFARASSAALHVVSTYELLEVPPPVMERSPLLDTTETTELLEKHGAAVAALIGRMADPRITTSSAVIQAYPPARSIVDQARKIDANLIVVGASGHNAWQRLFLGSTATRVLSCAHCPVLVVPSPEQRDHERSRP